VSRTGPPDPDPAPDPAPGLSLVERAVRALEGGARETVWIAREVLRIEGHPGAAARAVHTLLGGDPRFRVDERGTWSLDPAHPPPGPPLSLLRFAVVDVETTGGGYARGHRITEIAVVPVEGGSVGAPFSTLVHPGRPIPPRIQSLTGITDRMVAEAPPFDLVADRLLELFSGRVFTAHNVGFDWGFVEGHLQEARGEVPGGARLCTVRMGRALVPGLSSYALDSLARHYRIPIEGRHRALGDALATARILVHLLDAAEREGAWDLGALEAILKERGGRRPRGPRPSSGLRRRRPPAGPPLDFPMDLPMDPPEDPDLDP
jgi:DNA polymerase III epsilon subunit family exonuclease